MGIPFELMIDRRERHFRNKVQVHPKQNVSKFYSKLQNALANLIQIIHDAIVAKSFANYLQIETELDLRSTHDSILWW